MSVILSIIKSLFKKNRLNHIIKFYLVYRVFSGDVKQPFYSINAYKCSITLFYKNNNYNCYHIFYTGDTPAPVLGTLYIIPQFLQMAFKNVIILKLYKWKWRLKEVIFVQGHSSAGYILCSSYHALLTACCIIKLTTSTP